MSIEELLDKVHTLINKVNPNYKEEKAYWRYAYPYYEAILKYTPKNKDIIDCLLKLALFLINVGEFNQAIWCYESIVGHYANHDENLKKLSSMHGYFGTERLKEMTEFVDGIVTTNTKKKKNLQLSKNDIVHVIDVKNVVNLLKKK